MKITVRLMDVWRLDSSRVLVVRDPQWGSNKFFLASCKTGERYNTGVLDARGLYDYLVCGVNPQHAYYIYEYNLSEKHEQTLPGHGSHAVIPVWSEDVVDPIILTRRAEQEAFHREKDFAETRK